MRDVSIILPSIRPQNLEKFYEAAKQNSCDFEIVIVSPYELPKFLEKDSRIKYLRSYASPTVASQLGTRLCNAKYLYNTTDDGLIEKGAMDEALNMLEVNSGIKQIINMIYEEGVLDPYTLEPLAEHNSFHPPQYWWAYYHGSLRLPGIRSNWKMCMHFLMSLDQYIAMGGYDCRFEYSNHAIHDLMFRCQADNTVIFELPRTAFKCSHLPDTTGDHGPVNDAQLGPDTQLFNSIYSRLNATDDRLILPYDNWKKQPDVWTRRFTDVK